QASAKGSSSPATASSNGLPRSRATASHRSRQFSAKRCRRTRTGRRRCRTGSCAQSRCTFRHFCVIWAKEDSDVMAVTMVGILYHPCRRSQGETLMTFDPLAPGPLLTADLPGIGGRIKEFPEDFEVEEIPAYEPCGQGEYVYLWLEKRGMGHEYFIRQVA